MALDPQAAHVIELIVKSGRPPYHQLAPKDARELFRETRPASTPPAPQIGAVRGREADGPHGAIPPRLYRPAGGPDSRRLTGVAFLHGGGPDTARFVAHDGPARQCSWQDRGRSCR